MEVVFADVLGTTSCHFDPSVLILHAESQLGKHNASQKHFDFQQANVKT